MIKINLQIQTNNQHLPKRKDFIRWINHAGAYCNFQDKVEIGLRIVDADEIQELNDKYRHKNQPTNVLSFPYSDGDEEIGDIVICADVVEKEAKKQHTPIMDHWAHIVIHGILHLAGYDHKNQKEAEEMESLEIKILKPLAITNPYS